MLQSLNHDSPLREHRWNDDFSNVCVINADLQHQNETFPITDISERGWMAQRISHIQLGQEQQTIIMFHQLCFITEHSVKTGGGGESSHSQGCKAWKR